jgi:hypothetical protein
MSWKNGNKRDGRHYWLTPPDLYKELDNEFHFDYDPCPYPLPGGYNGLTAEWGHSNFVNPPFGQCVDQHGKKVGLNAWVKKCIEENNKGKNVVLIVTHYAWEVLIGSHVSDNIRNLGNVRWCATEDGKPGRGAGPTSAYILRARTMAKPFVSTPITTIPIKRMQITFDF